MHYSELKKAWDELTAPGAAFELVVQEVRGAPMKVYKNAPPNVRAVWLFSRNDAIGNLMVVLAAGLVFWTGTQWPDLVVAFIIAGLFLQSAWSIIRDARSDLRDAKG